MVTAATDYREAVEMEIRINWELMHRYRREAKRGGYGVEITHEFAARCKTALLTLLDVRRRAEGRS